MSLNPFSADLPEEMADEARKALAVLVIEHRIMEKGGTP